ncbi:MAG TPA: glycoside hydrolase family 2, partial [Naasia sp.]
MIRASEQDGSYPRPQLVREEWTSLDGEWEFDFDDALAWDTDDRRAPGAGPLPRRIQVPFAPESELSGIHLPGPYSVLWYRRAFTNDRAPGERVILHFGAVDHEARVW